DQADRGDRTEVLFELSQPPSASSMTTKDMSERFVTQLRAIQKKYKVSDEDVAIEPLRNYVGACLTRKELFELRFETKFDMQQAAGGIDYDELRSLKPFYRAWRNATKVALINRSVHTLQAYPAHNAYSATGRDIHWAVLDSGINVGHPHFETYDSIVASFDCR